MRSGRTYEVYVDGKPVGLVGSTTTSLKARRKLGYVKRFGPTVELKIIREVPRPEGYTDREYDFRLKAAEAFDIAAHKYYREDGGLNKMSPLVQALGQPLISSEAARIGGYTHVYSGHLDRIRTSEGSIRGGHTQGLKNIENGHLEKMRAILTPSMRNQDGLAWACKRWNIDRDKHCVCGRHIFAYG